MPAVVNMDEIERGYRWKLAAAIGGLCGLLSYCVTIALRRILKGQFSDFAAFYSAAGALRMHSDPYFPAQRSYLYPPLVAFLYMPLTLMSEQKAAAIALTANVIYVVTALLILAKQWIGRL